ncbi:MAG: hypothetical protein R3B93_28285 [Bacteroidia bacterium]
MTTQFWHNPGNAGAGSAGYQPEEVLLPMEEMVYPSINLTMSEDITVLKGAAAAALYGSYQRWGNYEVTTKREVKGKVLVYLITLTYTNETHWTLPIINTNMAREKMGSSYLPNPIRPVDLLEKSFKPGMTQSCLTELLYLTEPVYDRVRKFFRSGHNPDQHPLPFFKWRKRRGLTSLYLNSTYLPLQHGIVPNNEYAVAI